MSVCRSVRPSVLSFSWKISTTSGGICVRFYVVIFMKIGREKLSLVKVREAFEALDMKTELLL